MLSLRRSSRKTNIKGFRILLCILAVLWGVSCAGESQTNGAEAAKQEIPKKEAAVHLLPSADDVGGWAPEGELLVFHGDALFEHINGGADIYHEYGFANIVVQQYDSSGKSISVEIYHMDDASAAFGIYSYNRHPALSGVEIGGDGSIHANGLFFWQDKYYVDIRRVGAEKLSHSDFETFAKAIEAKIGGVSEAPPIMGLLPSENMIARSEVFARGQIAINNQVYIADDDLFGLAENEYAAIARYKLRQPECSVVIAKYINPDACQEAYVRFRAHFLGPESARENEFTAMVMPAKYHSARIEGSRLLIVANADSEKNALEVMDRVSEAVSAGSTTKSEKSE